MLRENLSSGFLTRSDKDCAVQPHKMVTGLGSRGILLSMERNERH